MVHQSLFISVPISATDNMQPQQQQQPSNVYQGAAAHPPPPSNVYQGTSPYNLQSVTDGMASMLAPSSPSVAPPTQPTQPAMGSITQFATPPPQQQQAPQSYAPSPSQSVAAPTGGSYAARSAMARAGGTTNSVISSPTTTTMSVPSPQPHHQAAASPAHHKEAHDAAQQTRILTDATRKVQEHSYYMKQAMDRDDLPQVLDRAMFMVGELGEHRNMTLNPKNYYELHMRALDDMPNLEEYFMGVEPVSFVYEATQYTPKVLPRLYLQICAASALIRSQDEEWIQPF